MEQLISVIVTAHNYERYVTAALRSAVSQNFTENFEVIVVNDGSKDSTGECILEFMREFERSKKANPKLEFIMHDSPVGLAASINEALRHAKGKYVVLLDADDLLEEDALSCLYDAISDSDAWRVCPDYVAIGPNDEIRYHYVQGVKDGLKGVYPLNAGNIFLREPGLKGFSEDLPRRQDIDFGLRRATKSLLS